MARVAREFLLSLQHFTAVLPAPGRPCSNLPGDILFVLRSPGKTFGMKRLAIARGPRGQGGRWCAPRGERRGEVRA